MVKLILSFCVLVSASVGFATAQSFSVQLMEKATNLAVTNNSSAGVAAGDYAKYNMKMGFTGKAGTIEYLIKSVDSKQVVLQQTVDFGTAGKQQCESAIEVATGNVISSSCGNSTISAEDTGSQPEGQWKVTETKMSEIAVPAGTFQALYVKAEEQTLHQVIEQWLNPQIIPITGMIKIILPSKYGPQTIELIEYRKN